MSTDPSKRVNIFIGDILVTGTGGKLRNHFPGPKYFDVKNEVFVELEKKVLAFLQDITEILNAPQK